MYISLTLLTIGGVYLTNITYHITICIRAVDLWLSFVIGYAILTCYAILIGYAILVGYALLVGNALLVG